MIRILRNMFSTVRRRKKGYYEEMIEKYPVVSIEDPLDEDDWEGWKTLTGSESGYS